MLHLAVTLRSDGKEATLCVTGTDIRQSEVGKDMTCTIGSELATVGGLRLLHRVELVFWRLLQGTGQGPSLVQV
jgi:hypothetical protein